MVPFHLYRPNSTLASDQTIRAVFVETLYDEDGTPEVKAAIDYDSGVLLIIYAAPQAITEDPSAFWTKKASENDGRSVDTVLGGPALVIQRNVNKTDNPSAVSLVIDGLQVTMYGQYNPIDAADLVKAANTLS
jgi:hypothetical protein